MLLDTITLPIIVPLVAGWICLLLPERWNSGRAWLSVAASGLTLFFVCQLFAGGNQSITVAGCLPLRMDELSAFVLLFTAVFAVLVAVFSLDYMKGSNGHSVYFSCLLLSLAFSCGVVLADDFVFLLTCWGLLALTLYLMIALAGPDSSDAARKTLIIVGGSDSLLLLGIALIWVQHGSSRLDAGALRVDTLAGCIAFFCLAAAVFAKVASIPLHSWLPDSGEKAYAPVTAYLPASVDKLVGIYLLARMVMDLFEMTDVLNTLLMILGAVTIVGGAMMALVQSDLKRLLAYCAISQVGYILLAIGTGTSLGLVAALFHTINHAIYKSCLFLGAGVIEKKAGTVDLDRLGGLATRLPVTFAACLIAALSVSGIPPLNGFASKWMVYQSVIEAGQDSGSMLWVIWLTAAMLGSALTLAIMVKLLHGAFLCKPAPQIRESTFEKAAWPAATTMTLLALSCVVFGIYANVIPLSIFILPVVDEPVSFPGTWWAGQTSILLLIAFLLGWIVYGFTMRNGRLRKCPTFVGGERLDESLIPGVPSGPTRHVEVTGVDFYRTIERLPALKPIYGMASQKMYDVYNVTGTAVNWLSNALRQTHSGQLPLYLVWCIAGLVTILYVMMGRFL